MQGRKEREQRKAARGDTSELRRAARPALRQGDNKIASARSEIWGVRRVLYCHGVFYLHPAGLGSVHMGCSASAGERRRGNSCSQTQASHTLNCFNNELCGKYREPHLLRPGSVLIKAYYTPHPSFENPGPTTPPC